MTEFEGETENLSINETTTTVISLLDTLQELVESAGGSLLGAGYAKINRDQALDLIGSIRETLPEELTQADGIIAGANQVVARANEEAQGQIADAQNEAQRLLKEAQAQADSIREDASAQAQQTIADAHQEAERHLSGANDQAQEILADAKAEAERLVSAQEVTRNAQEQAEQTLRKAQNEANKLTVDANTYARRQLDELVQKSAEVAKIAASGRDAIDARLAQLQPHVES